MSPSTPPPKDDPNWVCVAEIGETLARSMVDIAMEKPQSFQEMLMATIDLIENATGASPAPDDGVWEATGTSLMQTLSECETVLKNIQTKPPEPIRSIHHFACTGGTLMSKCIATAPNVYLFSEIDPLSTIHLKQQKRPFFPTDLLADLPFSPRPSDDSLKLKVFISGLTELHSELESRGQKIVIRDHAHSHFCMETEVPDRPNLKQILSQVAPTLSVLTVRHPLDAFLSLKMNNWLHFNPQSLDEYSKRKLAFISSYDGVPRFKFEDFLEAPAPILQSILDELQLEYFDDFEEVRNLFRISGDSGRKSARIGSRSRREIPDQYQVERDSSHCYRALCKLLDYTP